MQLGLMVICKYSLSAFHPAAPGSSPKHTIYAFSIYIVQTVYLSIEFECEKNENKTKRGRDWPIFLKKIVNK